MPLDEAKAEDSGLGVWVWGLGFRVLGFRVLGSRVGGLGFRV